MPRIAKALDTLRRQVQTEFPTAPKAEFGWIGDTRHQARKSDHNPNASGVVLALDIPHCPEIGLNTYVLADYMKQHPDSRCRYIISNGRIWNPSISPKWRPYRGANKHDHHMHVSVAPRPALYDNPSQWDLGFSHGEH